jgi:hypothetical protein
MELPASLVTRLQRSVRDPLLSLDDTILDKSRGTLAELFVLVMASSFSGCVPDSSKLSFDFLCLQLRFTSTSDSPSVIIVLVVNGEADIVLTTSLTVEPESLRVSAGCMVMLLSIHAELSASLVRLDLSQDTGLSVPIVLAEDSDTSERDKPRWSPAAHLDVGLSSSSSLLDVLEDEPCKFATRECFLVKENFICVLPKPHWVWKLLSALIRIVSRLLLCLWS